ncbi:D-tyrosyl-tRNA(Tyr) deacylase [bacterium]|nr:MAG: D-tyrosyl-tRNA(Tyr) deacylase [bacterium]
MKAVLQRVTRAQVEVEGEVVGSVGTGFCIFVGVGTEDRLANAEKMVQKIAGMRVFSDADGKFNLSLADVSGGVLLVSNFTLFGDARKGNRPFFGGAARPEIAEELFEQLATLLRAQGIPTQTGVFGADMKVQLENDGPVTLILEF